MKLVVRRSVVVLLLGFAPLREARPDQRQDEQALIEIERDWAAAYVRGDLQKLDALFGESYIQTNTRGRVTNKTEELADLRSGRFHYDKFDTTDINVQLYGDAAVVTGLILAKGTDTTSGKTQEGQMRMTDTFIRKNGHWLVVASQTTLVPSEPAVSGGDNADHRQAQH